MVFLGPVGPPFYELGNPPPVGNFSQVLPCSSFEGFPYPYRAFLGQIYWCSPLAHEGWVSVGKNKNNAKLSPMEFGLGNIRSESKNGSRFLMLAFVN